MNHKIFLVAEGTPSRVFCGAIVVEIGIGTTHSYDDEFEQHKLPSHLHNAAPEAGFMWGFEGDHWEPSGLRRNLPLF